MLLLVVLWYSRPKHQLPRSRLLELCMRLLATPHRPSRFAIVIPVPHIPVRGVDVVAMVPGWVSEVAMGQLWAVRMLMKTRLRRELLRCLRREIVNSL